MRRLLVTRAGPESLHESWLGAPGEARGFDLLVSSYAQGAPEPLGNGLHFEHRPGPKVAALGALMEERAAFFAGYDQIAFADDDLTFDPGTVRSLFGAAEGYAIAQPALTHDSHFSYGGLLAHPGLRLRRVTFVEMMFPIFSRAALERLRPLYGIGLEVGIDLVWCNALPGARFAVIDAHPVRHTRAVGGAAGFEGRTYADDIARALEAFDLPWLPFLPYAAERTGGRAASRAGLHAAAARMIASALRRSPDPLARRKLATYAYHLATRRPENRAVDFAAGLGRLAA